MFAPADVPAWDSEANASHTDSQAGLLTSFDVTLDIGALNTGANLLAIHGLNQGSGSSDFLMSAELAGITETQIGNPFENLLAVHNDLRITEIMYNPAGKPDHKEFVELQNTGAGDIDLTGVRFTDGIDFIFPAMTLGPGEYVVAAANLTEFQDWYGTEINAIGSYAPDKDENHFSNGSENVTLRMPAPYDAAILRFEYNEDWYDVTDGNGASLVIVDPLDRRAVWENKEAWYPSGTAGGSPGVEIGRAHV